MKLLGKRLRSCRLAKRLSQDIVAEEIGITTKFYSSIERGVKGMSLETLLKLKSFYDVDLNYLLFGKTQLSIETSLSDILNQIDPLNMKYAEDILRAFAQSHQNLSLMNTTHQKD